MSDVEKEKAEYLRLIHEVLMEIKDELRRTRKAQETIAAK